MIILRSALFSNKEQKRLRKQWEESLRKELEETSFLANQDLKQLSQNISKDLNPKYIGDPTVNAGISIVRDYNRSGANPFYNNEHVIKNHPDELESKAKMSIEDLKHKRQLDLASYKSAKQHARRHGGNLPSSYSANPNAHNAGVRKGVAEHSVEKLAAEESLARKEKAKELRKNNKLKIAIRDAKRYIKKNPKTVTGIVAGTALTGGALYKARNNKARNK